MTDKQAIRLLLISGAAVISLGAMNIFILGAPANAAATEAEWKMECYSGGIKIHDEYLKKEPTLTTWGVRLYFLDGAKGYISSGSECYFTEVSNQTAGQKRSGAIIREGLDNLLRPKTPE